NDHTSLHVISVDVSYSSLLSSIYVYFHTTVSSSHITVKRHLHSFPTRRSSDLSVPERLIEALGRHGPDRDRAAAGAVGRQPAARSEEHTSELQSRVDVVCRLLLEKKK